MRIVAGRFRGRSLASVGKGDPAAHLRPTTDRVREALFNVLGGGRFGDPFEGAVLDMFAGTGALGLEALSRGCSEAVFVENGRRAQRLLSDNIRMLGVSDQTRIVARDATRLPVNSGMAAGLVFLDPPYGKDLAGRALASARAAGWIDKGAFIVLEENSEQPAPEGYGLLEHRRYGDTIVTLLQADHI